MELQKRTAILLSIFYEVNKGSSAIYESLNKSLNSQ